MQLDDLTVLNDLRERLAKITTAQIDATDRKLDPVKKKEEVVGDIDSPLTRALYALVFVLRAEELTFVAQAQAEIDEFMEDDQKKSAAFLDMLGDVARELFWAQAKVDCGFHKKANVGIRKGWKLVEEQRQEGFMASMMRGTLPPGMMPEGDE